MLALYYLSRLTYSLTLPKFNCNGIFNYIENDLIKSKPAFSQKARELLLVEKQYYIKGNKMLSI